MASRNNVVGFRTSPRVVPSVGPGDPWQTMGIAGPMARTVADLVLQLRVHARPESRDPLNRPLAIPDVVEAYVEAAAEKGYREVRLIHGKGRGVQRGRVQQILAEHPLVEEFFDAPPTRGAWGATVARLRTDA